MSRTRIPRSLIAVFAVSAASPMTGHAHNSPSDIVATIECTEPAEFEDYVPNRGWTVIDESNSERYTFTAFYWESEEDLAWYKKGVSLEDKEYYTLEVENHIKGYTKKPLTVSTEAHFDQFYKMPCQYPDVDAGSAFQNAEDTDHNIAAGSACARHLKAETLYYTRFGLKDSNVDGTFARTRFQRGRWKNKLGQWAVPNIVWLCREKMAETVDAELLDYADAGYCAFVCHDHPTMSFDVIRASDLDGESFPNGPNLPMCARWLFEDEENRSVGSCIELTCDDGDDNDLDGDVDCEDSDCDSQCEYLEEMHAGGKTDTPWLPFPSTTNMGTTNKPGCGGHSGRLHHSYDFNVAGPYELNHDLITVASSNGTVASVVDHVQGSCYSLGIEKCRVPSYNYGWGNCVILKLDGYDEIYERYCHLDRGPGAIFVSEGDHVCHGTPLGRIGNTGYSDGAHLHWQREDANGQSVPIDRFVEFDIPDECGWCYPQSNNSGECYISENVQDCSPGEGGCPYGDGLYCGADGQDSDSLYNCVDGDYSLAEQCPYGCQDAGPGNHDYCRCEFGSGLYCGKSELGQNNDTLYQCSNGEYDLVEVCQNGCQDAGAGNNDYCINPECGDSQCNGDENCETCPSDCGNCPPGCPDNSCNNGETCNSCPQDCGVCPPVCGDNQCNGNEDCDSCSQDCGACPCSDTYAVTQYQCNSFSFGDGGGGGGGEIFEICASINSQTGFVTVKARKNDNSNFGNRPYQVQVSDPNDGPCGPNNWFFVESDNNPSGIGTSELTFTFQSLWGNETSKAYCVTASTQQGDIGYDPNSDQQTSWWHSRKAIVTKNCL